VSLTPSLNSPSNDMDLDPLLRNLARSIELEPTVSAAGEETEGDIGLGSECLAADILEQVRFGGLAQSQELEPGTLLGSYRLLEVLGVGGMSTVYRAEHIAMRRRVALKVLLFSLASSKQFVDRFYREAQAAARLDHPNVVKVHDINSQGNIHYLVMEFVDGRTVREAVNVGGPLSIPQAMDYLSQTVSALAHAHAHGIVHRDIKPENLVLETSGRIKLLDLGLARLSEIEDRLLTVYDTMLGTVDYIAPEQAENSHDVDARADIYSLGCTLYFMLAGHPPFPTGTPAQRLMFHLLKQPTRLSTLRNDIPESLEALLTKTMAKSPADRYQTAEELAAALDDCVDVLAGRTPKAKTLVPPAVTAPARKRPAAGKTPPPEASKPAKATPAAPPTPAKLGGPGKPATTVVWSPGQASTNVITPPTAVLTKAPGTSSAVESPAAPLPKVTGPLPEIRVTVRRLLDLWANRLTPDYAEAVREKIRLHSQVAEIYRRIESVAERSWLDAPEIEDAQMDPSDVAAYLDNMPAEKGVRTKYESLSLEADIYLAETADCLKLMASQPAPPANPRQCLGPALTSKIYGMADRVGQIEQRVGRLLVGLNDKDTFVRELSAEALGRIGPEAVIAANKLETSTADPDRRVREVVRDALRKIRGNPDKTDRSTP